MLYNMFDESQSRFGDLSNLGTFLEFWNPFPSRFAVFRSLEMAGLIHVRLQNGDVSPTAARIHDDPPAIESLAIFQLPFTIRQY